MAAYRDAAAGVSRKALDRPALSRLTVSSPEPLAPFRELNAGKAWPDQVKPFNFLLVGHVRPFGQPVGVDPTRFQPVAPYEGDPTKWAQLPWIDRYSGKQYRVGSFDERDNPEAMHLQTYRDVVREFRTHPEAKSAGADVKVCMRHTVGLLQRRVVRETYAAHVGKEANKLEEVEAGLERDPEVIYTEYGNNEAFAWRTQILPQFRIGNVSHMAEATGISERTIYSLRRGETMPRASTRQRIAEVLNL